MIKEAVLYAAFPHENALYQAYMPFISGGGLFIRTLDTYSLGQQVELHLTLPQDTESHAIKGKVVWITPKAAQSGKPAGIGIQFLGEKQAPLRQKIETCLAGMLNSVQITDTM